jgi:SNF2 family DNA or RNA helicase
LISFKRKKDDVEAIRSCTTYLQDEMGLGKSVQALAAAAAYFPQDWPLLITCPSSLR